MNLNIPAFLNEKQLSVADVNKSRKIASVGIHVERVIGRIKTFQIVKGVIPISMSRLTNQIVFVCSFLTNFFYQPWCRRLKVARKRMSRNISINFLVQTMRVVWIWILILQLTKFIYCIQQLLFLIEIIYTFF